LASDGTLSYKLANLDPLVGVSNSSLTKDVVGSISDATTQASNDGLTENKAIINNQNQLKVKLFWNGLTEINSIFKNQNQPIVKVFWASDLLANPEQGVMHSGNILLQHKITDRTVYDQAWQLAVERGGFDALFVNERGFVTEGGRSSVFVKPKGSEQWLTPPVSAGVLPGVMRSIVLNDPIWQAREVDLTVADVMGAEEIMLSNALRGLIPAYLNNCLS
jgi:branched-subunit amino acid aminotransferase/4-amino-4-deoxychorismate lyase